MRGSSRLKHLAIIMDGNGRWAQSQSLDRVIGHERGAKTAIEVTKYCAKHNIETLTLYALSSENMTRPLSEVSFILELMRRTLLSEKAMLIEQGIAVQLIGDWENLGYDFESIINEIKIKTKNNIKMTLNIAINYSGRWHFQEVCKQVLADQEEKTLDNQKLSKTIEKYYYQAIDSDPDILIRTGNEKRLSNFMLWHLAYTELFFESAFWPAFTVEQLAKILSDYQSRNRRFGQVSSEHTHEVI